MVDFMKKIFILVFLFLILLLLNDKDEVALVNKEITNDEMFVVLLSIPGLNTNNFVNYFDNDIKIIGIYPAVNILYKNKIGNVYYEFNSGGIKKNINDFTKFYKNKLKKNNFNNDLNLINYRGINIDKVEVYVNNDILKNFIYKCTKCKYEKILK